MTTLASPAGEPVRDLVLDLAALATNPSLTALGINRDTHIAIDIPQQFPELLERLMEISSHPQVPDWDGALHKPVLRSLASQSQREDKTQGMFMVRIEPSTQVVPGVYVQTNDHFDADPESIDQKPEQLLDQLTSGWFAAMLRADRVVGYIKEALNAHK